MADVSASDIIKASFDGIRAQAGRIALWYIVITASGILIDRMSSDLSFLVIFGYAILSFVAQSDIVRRHLILSNVMTADSARQLRIGSLFFLSLIYGSAVGLGLVLLILPGIYVASRWWIGTAAMFAENGDAISGLRSSWDKTINHVPAISLVLVFSFIPSILSVLFYVYGADDTDTLSLSMSTVSNALSSVSYIFMWISGSVTYVMLKGDKNRLTEIFE